MTMTNQPQPKPMSKPARWVVGILAVIGASVVGSAFVARCVPDPCRDAQRRHVPEDSYEFLHACASGY